MRAPRASGKNAKANDERGTLNDELKTSRLSVHRSAFRVHRSVLVCGDARVAPTPDGEERAHAEKADEVVAVVDEVESEGPLLEQNRLQVRRRDEAEPEPEARPQSLAHGLGPRVADEVREHVCQKERGQEREGDGLARARGL